MIHDPSPDSGPGVCRGGNTSTPLGSPLKLEAQPIRPILPATRARGRAQSEPAQRRVNIKGAGSAQNYMLGQSSEIYDQGPGSRESSP